MRGTTVVLRDWRCEGVYEGRECRKVLTAYDPAVLTLAELKRTQQLKCGRCGHFNGIPFGLGRREEGR